MINHLVLGNIFSLCSVVCLGYSVMKNSKKDLVKWQICDTFFCVLQNIVLGSYSGVSTTSISLIRNILSFKNLLTKKWTIFLTLIGVFIGIIINNLGIIGYAPILATSSYTIGLYLAKNEQQMRYLLILNLFLWFIHDIYILAYPHAIMDIGLSLWTAYQAMRAPKK